MRSNSGKNTAVSPVSYAVRISSGWFDVSSLTNSIWMRSALTFAMFGASSTMAALVSSSNTNPSCAEKRTALSMRSASSEKRSVARPTQRMIPRFKSPTPSKASTSPCVSLYAIALIVKSLRFRSSSRSDVNETSFGCLASSYSPSIRYVVTSKPSCSSITVTVPCKIPVSIVCPKSCFTSCGFAEVVISQSIGVLFNMTSRTQPPTAYASYPALINVLIIKLTFSGNAIFIYDRFPSSTFL